MAADESAATRPLPRQNRHKTLSAYYTRLYTLHDYILSAPGSSQRRVLLDNDNDEYRRLIRETLCGVTGDAPVFPGKGQASHRGQQEVLDQVIAEVGRRSLRDDVKDVLVAGDKYSATDLPVHVARSGHTVRSTNSPAAILRTKPWRILRTRVGDDAFRHLLLHTSLFLPVGNNCFMQLNGEPIYEKYQHVQPRPQSDKGASGAMIDDPSKRSRARKRRKLGNAIETDEQEDQGSHPVPKRGPASVTIARQKMFYAQPARRPSGSLIYGLPPQHVLSKLSHLSPGLPSDAACFALLKSIFPSLSTPKPGRHARPNENKGSRQRIPRMLGAMREVLVRHARLDFTHEVRCCITHSQVCRFTSTILKKTFGPALLGGDDNLRALIKHARRLIEAKQYEAMSLHGLMQGIAVGEITWLRASRTQRPTAAESTKQRSLAQDLIRWVFEEYLIPLLRNTFYITETATTRYQTVYFAQEDWQTATKPHFESLRRDFLQELDSNERHFAYQGPLGVSAVRLIPKPNGFRPIVNLGRKIKGQAILGISTTGAKGQSANQVLRTVHQVLTFEKACPSGRNGRDEADCPLQDRKRAQLGSCLFGTNEVFAPLQSLKTEVLQIHGQRPRLYFAKMDIKAAFDTIKQDRMLQIIEKLLDQDHDYCLMLYCLLLPPASKASQGSARRLFKQRAVLDDGASTGFDDHAADIARPLRNAVLVDMARRRNVTKESCLQLLRQHIKSNVWQIGSKLYRQKEGIPQGSKISSLLCSIFYASLEAQYLAFVHRPGSRLLRYIDDFLLVTDDLYTARRFVDVMRAGFPEYGAYISPAKTLLSFGCPSLPLAQRCQGDQFPFCGFVIDIRSLDMGMDHSRVLGGPIEQSFALRFHRRKGAAFLGWLSRQLENRNHVAYVSCLDPLYNLDTQHNSLETVCFNVFLNFAMTAMKIPAYLRSEERLSHRRCATIYHSLCLAIEYTHIAGRARVKHASRGDPGVEHYGIKKADFVFLAKVALQTVLSRKAARMKGLVDLLAKDLARTRHARKTDQLDKIVKRGCEAIKTAMY